MTIKRKLLAGIFCFLSFLLFYGITARSHAQVCDEAVMLASGVSLVEDSDLAIDELQWLQNDVDIGLLGRGGQLYSKYFPGNVYVSALIYKLTARQNDQPYMWSGVELAASNTGARLALKLNAVFGALAMTALLLLLIRYFDWRTAIITVLLVGVCSDWQYQSRGFMSEVGAGAFMIVSLCFMAYQRPYYSSLALGLSLLFRPTNLIALPIWGKAVLDKGLKTIWSGFFILVGLLGLALFNWIRFASFLNFGYGTATFKLHLLQGLYGIILSPGRSIFVYSPILTLAIPGAWMLYKKNKSLAVVSSFTVLSHFIVVALWQNWDGGWTWGSRLLTPIVPILGFLIAPMIEYARGKRGDLLVIWILALFGLGVQILALTKDPFITLVENITYNNVDYGESILTLKNSWIALQFRSLQSWHFCDLDAYTLRQWFWSCR
jgi:hypothetical protein